MKTTRADTKNTHWQELRRALMGGTQGGAGNQEANRPPVVLWSP